MHDGSLYCAPCAISTSTNDKNPSPVQESILACTGKGRTCKCDSCAASRREKAKIQKRNSRARKKFQLQNDITDRGKCQTMGACDCIQHAVQTQNAINAEKKAALSRVLRMLNLVLSHKLTMEYVNKFRPPLFILLKMKEILGELDFPPYGSTEDRMEAQRYMAIRVLCVFFSYGP